MNVSDIRAYYERPDIRDALLAFARDREVAGVFRNGEFSRRPNNLAYPKDITAMVRQGVMEFHCSIEHWTNPMALKQANHDQLRKGWDLIFDLDCKEFEHGKVAAQALMGVLRDHDISNISIKFTGGKGFHLGIPWKALPRDIGMKPTAGLFPGLARNICDYLKQKTTDRFEQALLARWDPEELAGAVGKPLEKVWSEGSLDPWAIVELDPVLVSPRHLFRMPYSLHKGSHLVSLPIRPSELEGFEKDRARPDRIRASLPFMGEAQPGEAELLVQEAADWHAKRAKKGGKKTFKKLTLQKPLPKEYFPPCIQNVLSGLQDGRKRSVFVLVNFLRNMKWGWDDIERELLAWNQKNQPPLPETYVVNQFRYARKKGSVPLPPNCEHTAYYKGYGVCAPNEFCRNIRNPVTHPFRVLRMRGPRRGFKPRSKK